jgi:NADPH:quinone reductase-like Zn-dependent oxidoreductase
MKANRVREFGSPAVIAFKDVPVPAPALGEVLVRVDASGVGPWDSWIRAGKSVLPQPLPLTLGSDLSGVVERVGDGVTSLKVGDEVFGVTNPRFTNANAEYAIAVADMLALKPKGLSHVQAASVPVVAVTAWQMLFEHARIDAGQTALILGGAGNVGAYAVQLARTTAARVVATASGDALDDVARLGASQVIDYRTQRLEDAIGSVDAVIDTVGGEMQQRALGLLKRGGTLISAVSQPDAAEAEKRGVKAAFFLVEVNTERLNRIAAMFDAGDLEANVGAILPLAEARTAHEMLDGIRTRPRGKIVLGAEA